MRGDTLAEGIAVKAPGGITAAIIRDLVDDIVLVNEDEIERAVALLIAIEKTVVEGAGAAGLAALLAEPERLPDAMSASCCAAATSTPGCSPGDDPRTGARGTARIIVLRRLWSTGPASSPPCQPCSAESGANIIDVSHQRTFSDLPAKGTLLEVVIETRDRAHLDDVMKRLGEAGYTAWLPGRRSPWRFREVCPGLIRGWYRLSPRKRVKEKALEREVIIQSGRLMFALVRITLEFESGGGLRTDIPSRRGLSGRRLGFSFCPVVHRNRDQSAAVIHPLALRLQLS